MWVTQPSRRLGARPFVSRYVASTGPNGVRWSGAEVIPCFANSPTLCSTWQRPQIPRPPQTESMSTPSRRAASRTVVPGSNRPRRPDGVKMTRGSAVIDLLAGSPGSAPGRGDGLAAGDALWRLDAVAPGPAPVDAPCPDLALRGRHPELTD